MGNFLITKFLKKTGTGFSGSKDAAPFRRATDYKLIAASVSTAQLGAGTNAVGDYIDRLVITAASTVAPGTVTLFDGTTAVGVYGFVPAGMQTLSQVVDIGMCATSTKGWNITTGTSVSCVAIGLFDNDGQNN